MTILTQHQLILCWIAAVDAHTDFYSGVHNGEASTDRLSRLPESDHHTHLGAHAVAYQAIEEGCGIHTATGKAEDALRELAVVAGVP